MEESKNVRASIARPPYDKNAKKQSKGITLIALIITIIVMLILVGVSVAILINSNMIGIAQDAANRTKTSYEEESNLGGFEAGGQKYNSIDEYMQNGCSHEWGEWVENTEEALKIRTCTKCGATETTEMLVIGAYIEGYNPGIGESGKVEVTSYTSKGAYGNNGSIAGGASGNGYGDQGFSFTEADFTTTEAEKTAGKTKWRILGEEDGQIIITPVNSIYTTAGSSYYLQGQAGYANMIEELNKISGLYGQGKYADTSKYNYTIDGKQIASGGRSVKAEDIGYTLTESTKTYTTNENGKVLNDNGTATSSSFTYWGEDDINPETGAGWYTLGANESVTMVQHILSGGDATKKSVVGTCWLAFRNGVPNAYGMTFDAGYLYNGAFNYYGLVDGSFAGSNRFGVRPVVYLKSDVQLEYNSETGVYTIVP